MATTLTAANLRDRAKELMAKSKRLGRSDAAAGRAPDKNEQVASLKAQLLAEELERMASQLEG